MLPVIWSSHPRRLADHEVLPGNRSSGRHWLNAGPNRPRSICSAIMWESEGQLSSVLPTLAPSPVLGHNFLRRVHPARRSGIHSSWLQGRLLDSAVGEYTNRHLVACHGAQHL